MRQHLPLLMLSVIALSMPQTVSSQVCLGDAPFSSGPVRASLGYQDESREDQFRGELGYEFSHSDFGVVGVQHAATRGAAGGFTSSSNVIDGMLGREFSLSGSSGRICPIGRLGYYSSSSSFAAGSSTAHGLTYDFGAAFGFDATDGPTRVVPSLALEYVGNRLNGTVTTDGNRQSGSFANQSRGLCTLALGIRSHGLTIAPYINRSFGQQFVGGSWGVNAAINLGTIRP